MKKSQKITAIVFLALSAILFIVLGAWNPCDYALIMPAFFAVIGLSTLAVAKIHAKQEQKQLSMNA